MKDGIFVVYAFGLFVLTVAMIASACRRHVVYISSIVGPGAPPALVPVAPAQPALVPVAPAQPALVPVASAVGPPHRPSPPMRPATPVTIATRGATLDYHQVGVLYDEQGKVLPLYGRPVYRGSQRWQYYTATDGFQSMRLGVTVDQRRCVDEQGCQELYDGDQILIKELGDKKYKASIYDTRGIMYDPMSI